MYISPCSGTALDLWTLRCASRRHCRGSNFKAHNLQCRSCRNVHSI